MRYKKIEGTKLTVSEICLGTAKYGGITDEKTSFELMDAFAKRGGTFLDTAHIYNDWIPGEKSRSEKVIGRWMKYNGNRKEIVIGTKCGHYSFTGKTRPRLSEKEILLDHDESLEFLQTDFIDIFYLHRDDPQRSVEEIIDTLEGLMSRGTIGCYACSNWSVQRMIEANAYAKRKYSGGFKADQLRWSLAKFNIDSIKDNTLVSMGEKELDFHKETEICVISYTSLANGFFHKYLNLDIAALPDSLKLQYINEYNINTAKKVEELIKRYSVSANAITLAYLASQSSFTTIPVVSFNNIVQLQDALDADKIKLDNETLMWLDEGRYQ